MTEQQQLLAAIIAEPGCDTLRLAYADWLDEHGEADRAEFIRLQVELGRLPDCQFKEYQSEDRCDQTARAWSISCRSCVARGRQKALINAHPEWLRMKCVKCAGHGTVQVHPNNPQSYVERCKTCDGIGDMFSRLDGSRPSLEVSRNPVFRRGLIEQVDCTLAELGEEREVKCEACNGGGTVLNDGYDPIPRRVKCGVCSGTKKTRKFITSPWAIAVATAHPVVRFKITNADIFYRHWVGGPRSWMVLTGIVLLDKMTTNYDSEDAAVDALAVAAGTLVRQYILKGTKV